MTITDLRTSTHEQLIEQVTTALQVAPGDASLYLSNPHVPPVRINAYPKRRPTAEPSLASSRPPEPDHDVKQALPADITYADFLRIDRSWSASIAI